MDSVSVPFVTLLPVKDPLQLADRHHQYLYLPATSFVHLISQISSPSPGHARTSANESARIPDSIQLYHQSSQQASFTSTTRDGYAKCSSTSRSPSSLLSAWLILPLRVLRTPATAAARRRTTMRSGAPPSVSRESPSVTAART